MSPRGLDREWDPASGLLLYRVFCRVKIFSAFEILIAKMSNVVKMGCLEKTTNEKVWDDFISIRKDDFTRVEIHLIYDQRS